MPIEIPEAAGESYHPSNGTEGMMFMELFCDRCRLEDFDPEIVEGGCGIQMRAMIHRIGEKDYPAEWVFDFAGHPTCTAFIEK